MEQNLPTKTDQMFALKPNTESLILEPCSLNRTYILIIFLSLLLANCLGVKPESIGQFVQCPDKPNCISSKSSISLHKVSPLTYQGALQEAKEKLLGIFESMPRTQISTDKEKFLHVEFTSKIFRFVDDVEFYFDEPGTIHFRSASRVGYSDMGVNRNRIEKIRRLFTEALSRRG